MIVAEIARSELEKKHPEILSKVNEIINVIHPFTKNGNYPFVESATYPDDIKYLGWKAFNHWHFNDYYHNKNGETVDLPRNQENIVWAIN